MISQTAGDALILDHMYLVPPIVREVSVRLPAHVNRDDLTSAGMLGLVLAGRSYDDTRGVPFDRWAAFKIRHAITDELRSMDWASRSVRPKARALEEARNHLAVKLGHSPADREVADELAVDVAEVGAADARVNRARVLSLQGFPPEVAADLMPDARPGPEQLLLEDEQLAELADALAALPERLRYVVTASYLDEQTMAPIAARLGVTETRISQLRSEAVRSLRKRLAA